MKEAKEPLTRTGRVGVSVVLAVALFFVTFWAALNGLRVFTPFDYERLKAAIWIGIAVSITGLIACLYAIWNSAIAFSARSTFTKLAAWLSVILAFDSLIVEPYLLRYFFPRMDLAGSLRWQFQLIIAGLLALAVAVSKRSWRWLPFSFVATAFGVLWLIGIFAPE